MDLWTLFLLSKIWHMESLFGIPVRNFQYLQGGIDNHAAYIGFVPWEFVQTCQEFVSIQTKENDRKLVLPAKSHGKPLPICHACSCLALS